MIMDLASSAVFFPQYHYLFASLIFKKHKWKHWCKNQIKESFILLLLRILENIAIDNGKNDDATSKK